MERALGPGFRHENCEVKLVGTPLTQNRFLGRNRGTYDPAIKAGEATFPGHSLPSLSSSAVAIQLFPELEFLQWQLAVQLSPAR